MIQSILRKFFPTAVLVFILCLLITGCSPSPISENKLLSYVEQDDPMVNRMPLYSDLSLDIQYHDLTVDKRLTDKDDKSDQVWIHFTADTKSDTADVEARMDFTLYNDGWLLDDIEVLSTDYSPLAGPRHDMVGSYLGEQYNYYQYQGEEVDLENKSAKLCYKAMDEYTYEDIGYVLCVYCHYAEPGWSYGEIELIEETQDWRRIYGEWELALPSDLYTIIIDSFDGSLLHCSYGNEIFSGTGYFVGKTLSGNDWYYDIKDYIGNGYLYISRSSRIAIRYQLNDFIDPNLRFTHKEEPTYSSTFYDEFFNDDEEVGLGGQ